MKKVENKAFTLSEVLIALTIIGVVAAMTIPSLMNNTNAEENRTSFKKSIASINNALSLSYAVNGISVNTCSNNEEAAALLKERMNVVTARMYPTIQQDKLSLVPAAYAAPSKQGTLVPGSGESTENSSGGSSGSGTTSGTSGGSTSGSTSSGSSSSSGSGSSGTTSSGSKYGFTNTELCSGTENVWETADGVIYCISSNFHSDKSRARNSVCNMHNTNPCTSDGNANLYIDVNGWKKPNRLTENASSPQDIYTAMIYSRKVVPYGEAAEQILSNAKQD